MKKIIEGVRKIAKWGNYGIAFVDIMIYVADRLEKVSKDKNLKRTDESEG